MNTKEIYSVAHQIDTPLKERNWLGQCPEEESAVELRK